MDELVLSVEDLLIKMKAWFAEEDSAKKVLILSIEKVFKVEIFRTLCETEITPFLNRFDSHLAENATGFFVGNKVSNCLIIFLFPKTFFPLRGQLGNTNC